MIYKRVFRGLPFSATCRIYNAVILNRLVFGLPAIYAYMTEGDVKKLSDAQITHLRALLIHRYARISNVFIFMETGQLNIEYVIQTQVLIFFHRLLCQNQSTLASKLVHECMESFPEHQFLRTVKDIATAFKMDSSDIWEMNQTNFKMLLKKSVRLHFDRCLNELVFNTSHETKQMQFYVKLNPARGPQDYLEHRFAPLRIDFALLRSHYFTGVSSFRNFNNCRHCETLGYTSLLNIQHAMIHCPLFVNERDLFRRQAQHAIGAVRFMDFWSNPIEDDIIQRLLLPNVLTSNDPFNVCIRNFVENFMRSWKAHRRLLLPTPKELAKKRKRDSKDSDSIPD